MACKAAGIYSLALHGKSIKPRLRSLTLKAGPVGQQR